ncbi:hypothetical protein D9M71_785750 [compost metagenome]
MVGSTPSTPSMVFSRIGHIQAKAMVPILGPCPMPNTPMIIGTSAACGTERKKLMIGSTIRRSHPTSPSNRPMPMPSTAAMDRPTKRLVSE